MDLALLQLETAVGEITGCDYCGVAAQRLVARSVNRELSPAARELRRGIGMKIVFLDIDGVLNCKSTLNPRKFPYVVDSVLLGRLERLISLTDASVVLASTWRYDPVGLLAAKFYGVPFIDQTPDMPKQPRCE